jgi:two-component system, LytTR family, response regulator
MKAIIVDDEPKAIELIKSYLDHFRGIELEGVFRNGLKAYDFLSKNPQVDLVFLDIDMPHISGISLSKMISRQVKVIFTTAYSEYAVESYEVQAVDYLMKPISLERFTRAMGKVMTPERAVQVTEQDDVIQVKSGSRIYFVQPDQIRFLEKDGNYMVYHLGDKKILARETVAEALERLPTTFIRVHKSFIINVKCITSLDHEGVYAGETRIPVGATFRE